MKRYRSIAHAADLGIEVYGKTLPELFQNAAFAFFDILLYKGKVSAKLGEKISVSADDTEQLLVVWLSEFLYLFDTKRFLVSRIEIKKFQDNCLEAWAEGEIFNAQKHSIKTEVKAVTYHGLKIEKKGSVYSTVIIFDI